jgi:hypothetical protein
MKVELTVNLKTAKGQIISAGSVFSDKDAPIPDFIMRRVEKRQAKIIEYNPPPPKITPVIVREMEEVPVAEVEAPKKLKESEAPEKPKKKKLLKRTSKK